jgi:ATP-dependent DNA helicase RecG
MDISIIKTKPEGRKEIKTTLVKFKDIKLVLNEMLEEIKQNHQVYIVCPLIEGDDESNLTDVTKLKEKIDLAFHNLVPTKILHGKQKNDEKAKIMEDFKNGKTKILISTTVIEVGVDVPNATMMVIFNAERFGLATIHQLRGRIGRNDLESKCILISDKNADRLKVLVESSDGFYISEQDFKMRGEGDLFGFRQSGDMVFKIADLRKDAKILTQANIDSAKFITNNKDSNFESEPQFLELIKEVSHID